MKLFLQLINSSRELFDRKSMCFAFVYVIRDILRDVGQRLRSNCILFGGTEATRYRKDSESKQYVGCQHLADFPGFDLKYSLMPDRNPRACSECSAKNVYSHVIWLQKRVANSRRIDYIERNIIIFKLVTLRFSCSRFSRIITVFITILVTQCYINLFPCGWISQVTIVDDYMAENNPPTPKPRGFKNIVNATMVESNIITTASKSVDVIRKMFDKPSISHVTLNKSPPVQKSGTEIFNKPDLGISDLTLEESAPVQKSYTKITDKTDLGTSHVTFDKTQPVKKSDTKIVDKPPDVHKTTPKEKKELTILLLGETGVGKSTFINAIVNYLSFESLDAANGQPICIIPVSFTLTDPDTYKQVKVTLGDNDLNENSADPTKSATQYPKCYKFKNDNIVLNIIDTPGIADTAGVDRDNTNMQNILDFIKLFTHLNKSAANNIIFLYTNARSTHYLPGDSSPALMSVLNKVKNRPPKVDITYNKETTYCFDNESFRYLVALVSPNNIQFDTRYKSSYVESWRRSVEECQRLFSYITQLTPHKVMDTLSLNNAKQIIQLLTKPMADITKNIADNINECERYMTEVNEYNESIENLQQKLYIPSVEIKTIPLDRPKTVCVEANNSDRYPGEPITLSRATLSKHCLECGHSYKKHLHVWYKTVTKLNEVTDQAVDSRLRATQSAAEAKERQILLLDQRIAELSAESETIVYSMAMFLCFLAANALTPLNDAFGNYVKHMIANESFDSSGADSPTPTADRLERVLEKYNTDKEFIKLAVKTTRGSKGLVITVEEIDESIRKLCKLKHKGKEINNMIDDLCRAKVENAIHNHVVYNAPTNTDLPT
ncbi:unnamed protein product [Medioppia subpectinata]|uniref:G domain-containing protein n=1 Tax=Medioppia subpectinata TaxID=1979941 RepID=A0A7R9PV34_9ACAR|nr:unnamed protein product [Medioppia subpectinata]CAG2101448.1 unnamed protein product [Medioppia subpectinata]